MATWLVVISSLVASIRRKMVHKIVLWEPGEALGIDGQMEGY
jgi:hypothetical protein